MAVAKLQRLERPLASHATSSSHRRQLLDNAMPPPSLRKDLYQAAHRKPLGKPFRGGRCWRAHPARGQELAQGAIWLRGVEQAGDGHQRRLAAEAPPLASAVTLIKTW